MIHLRLILFFAVSGFFFSACSQQAEDSIDIATNDSVNVAEFNPDGATVQTRYNPPEGFERVSVDSGSYGAYLRTLPLKPANSLVKYYNGNEKSATGVYRSVVDLPIGTKNLHQCADAVMRFRAEYLWIAKKQNQIHFNFTNGFRVDYSKWLEGNRMVVSGNKTYWTAGSPRSNTYQTFWNYMELIFNYAGTLSLEKELSSRPIADIQIGDVLIQGGSPGHAVIVVDLVQNPETGEKRFLLAQSYMPAQESQILINPAQPESSWFSAKEGTIRTPEWTFHSSNLKHF